mgnify:CR=1 FL=1
MKIYLTLCIVFKEGLFVITRSEVLETNKMIEDYNLDVRTITMGINLMDCADSNIDKFNEKVYHKITTCAKDLVKVGDDLAKQFGVPVVHKRISVTPIAIAAAGCQTDSSHQKGARLSAGLSFRNRYRRESSP